MAKEAEINEVARQLSDLVSRGQEVALDIHWRIGQLASGVSGKYGEASIKRLCDEIKSNHNKCRLTAQTLYKDIQLYRKVPEAAKDRARDLGISYRQFVNVLPQRQEVIVETLQKVFSGELAPASFVHDVRKRAGQAKSVAAVDFSVVESALIRWEAGVTDAGLSRDLARLVHVRDRLAGLIKRGRSASNS